MRVIAVVERPGGPVRAALRAAVGPIALVTAPCETPPPYDVVVWAHGPCAPPPVPLSARALAVCGENAGPALAHCRCGMVITYGFGVRDTLTPSATLGEGRVLSLQRGLMTLDGQPVEPMEVAVGDLCGDMETRMAVAAVCLLLGARPQKSGRALATFPFHKKTGGPPY